MIMWYRIRIVTRCWSKFIPPCWWSHSTSRTIFNSFGHMIIPKSNGRKSHHHKIKAFFKVPSYYMDPSESIFLWKFYKNSEGLWSKPSTFLKNIAPKREYMKTFVRWKVGRFDVGALVQDFCGHIIREIITVPNNIRHKFGINHSLLNLYLENMCNKKLLILFPIVWNATLMN